MTAKSHWESIYASKGATEVSWYQSEPAISLQLIRQVASETSAAIIDVGGGASTLADSLLDLGYTNLTVLDIAENALACAKARLGEKAEVVHWLADDVLTFDIPRQSIDVWHDRAVFHFLQSRDERQQYVEQVRRALRPDGHVIVATFAEDGPARCSGLPVMRYDAAQLHAEFGPGFHLRSTIREEHTTPSGARQSFRYCLCSLTPVAETGVGATQSSLVGAGA